ncbi:MAG: hypothetical protein CVV22_10230 [Ignavibacteriae bacterium HGW-Ignavibacteriae-1]|jgi:uncharacterized membrane protein YdjX (TVP38/TMEM64 family)|nr:MAG: hypothetical protein CVV22_10230 [Ignavibacteriae bacterium HGW-Ignavibacteriae-1]
MQSKYIKFIALTVLGGAIGYAYYYFVGCNTGTCPITSNWHVSTLYGAVIGFIAAFPSSKKTK